MSCSVMRGKNNWFPTKAKVTVGASILKYDSVFLNADPFATRPTLMIHHHKQPNLVWWQHPHEQPNSVSWYTTTRQIVLWKDQIPVLKVKATQQRFTISVTVRLDDIFWTAEPFVTKLGSCISSRAEVTFQRIDLLSVSLYLYCKSFCVNTVSLLSIVLR